MKPFRLFPLALAGALCGLGCGPSTLADATPATGAEARSQAIIGGTLAQGDPAVVSLSVRYGAGYESLCTGTLIAPKTVLTAAHCIYAYGQNTQYFVTLGTHADAPTRAILVAQQYKDPNYNQTSHDFGLLRLAQPILDVPPIPLNEAPMNSTHVGRAIRHVGYGLTVANGQSNGEKREVTYALRQVTAYTIESGAAGKQTCQGDSGGPGFMVMPGDTTEKLVGVVSYGDQNCAIEGFDGRVDIGAPWIRQTMGAWEAPTCATDGQCVAGCTPVDQDCVCKADGVCSAECTDPSMDVDCPRDCIANGICAQQPCGRPDVDCAAEGTLCSGPQQCKERLCVRDDQNPTTYCTRACQSASDCPATMECAVGSCRIKQRPVRQLFDSCSASSDFCTQSICTGPAGGISRCVKGCLVSGDCASGSVCEAGSDSQRFCRPANLRFTNITLPAATSFSGPRADGCTASGGALAMWLGLALLRRRRARG